ncbi:MAG: universal stress protein [Hyphomonadaceae bacterium]|nr:universal stress protein [Hyphomonadaceae bacterium]
MRDIMLHIDTYAEPILPRAIEQSVGFAKSLDAELTGVAAHIDISVPDNWLAERLLHINEMASVEESKSLAAARGSLELLETYGRTAGVKCEGHVVRAGLHSIGPCVARHARTRDLCLISLGDRMDSQRSVAEEVIFGSGRPTLIYHPDRAPLPKDRLKRVAIAWDGGRCAARAVCDTIPVLKKSESVRVLTVVGEKASATSGLASELVRHLLTHGINAQVDEIEGRRRSIGASLDAYIGESAPQLIVMGAYGSSRLKEFVLGGATEHVLNRLAIPAFLSH